MTSTNLEGDPVSTGVFAGDTSDLKTLQSQVEKAAARFGCQRVTFSWGTGG